MCEFWETWFSNLPSTIPVFILKSSINFTLYGWIDGFAPDFLQDCFLYPFLSITNGKWLYRSKSIRLFGKNSFNKKTDSVVFAHKYWEPLAAQPHGLYTHTQQLSVYNAILRTRWSSCSQLIDCSPAMCQNLCHVMSSSENSLNSVWTKRNSLWQSHDICSSFASIRLVVVVGAVVIVDVFLLQLIAALK